ncbi:cytochrome C oxidase subunit IV family protein [Hazenella coriacea]|uniref:Cytochrome c oxidase subunit 4 n=1 Tax=Hazenella coriacea TaxID=1179467 RepID=A0A4R3L4A1_9BACL|nr:cytochrome C oxidase subunit IV family protein [Hazenella coriacea]TCS92817.1 cytochrome c oxidase subunit 4 [Hazenella coriacea]
MTQQPNSTSVATKPASKNSSVVKYLLSFICMIGLTAAAFYIVANGVVANDMIFPMLSVLAVLQVLLQLFIFMHLDQKGSKIYSIFLFLGIFIAVYSAAGMVLMD